MASDALTLGSITFQGQEIPESIAFPKTQSYAKKKRIGGKRDIQTLGIDYGIVSWSGILRGSGAEDRSKLLDRILANASTQRLTFLSNAFDVVVVSYTPDFFSKIKVQYQISVEIQQDVSGQTNTTVPVSIDQQIASANQSANANLVYMAASDSNASALQPSYTAMNTALDAAGPAASATGITAQAASRSVATAVNSAQSYASTLPSENVSLLLASQQYLSNLQIIAKNFSAGQAPRTVTVSGGSFTALAVTYYQDASLAVALQNANNAASPNLPSNINTKIILPPLGIIAA